MDRKDAFGRLSDVLTSLQASSDFPAIDVQGLRGDETLESLGLDSVARLEVMVGLEGSLGVDLEPDPAKEVSTVDDLLSIMVSAMAQG